MQFNEKQINQLSKIGIKDVNRKTKSNLALVAKGYINKSIDEDIFAQYFDTTDTDEIMDVLKVLSNDNKDISKSVIGIIDKVTDVLKVNLANAKTEEERQEIRKDLKNCIDKAREESDSSKKIITLILSAVLLALGAAGKYFFDKFFDGE